MDYTGFGAANVDIKQVTAHWFDFTMQALAGANTGELEGKAAIYSSNKAPWHSTDNDFQNCSLGFKRILNRLEVGGRSSETSCRAGVRVDFSGIYVASENDPQQHARSGFAGCGTNTRALHCVDVHEHVIDVYATLHSG